MDIPFSMPPRHPYNPLPSLRLCIAAGSQIEHIRAIFDIIYGKGLQPDDQDGIQAIARAVDISSPETAISAPSVKEALRKNTEEAIADGVFGVPTFVIQDQIFWGGDATIMMLDFLQNPDLFETPEMKRISDMPMGLIRRT